MEEVNYFGLIVKYLTAIISCASILCAVTPTPKDNAILNMVYKFVEMLALNIGKAKE